MHRFKSSHLENLRSLSVDSINWYIGLVTTSRRVHQGIRAVAGTLRTEAIAAVHVSNDIAI